MASMKTMTTKLVDYSKKRGPKFTWWLCCTAGEMTGQCDEIPVNGGFSEQIKWLRTWLMSNQEKHTALSRNILARWSETRSKG
ncbi:hypothetical protein [Vibrio agarivorans]|uniref:Uncharacterized protein n=1 Tax=Vibrio agarivorans TaxID=153622 RepID=A0ABT7Y7A0_9VIBR|nr:hypothetical protein [Vibrio agarivorans]MDN2483929.1 hypothetical protein [Vibrio agarivorans]